MPGMVDLVKKLITYLPFVRACLGSLRFQGPKTLFTTIFLLRSWVKFLRSTIREPPNLRMCLFIIKQSCSTQVDIKTENCYEYYFAKQLFLTRIQLWDACQKGVVLILWVFVCHWKTYCDTLCVLNIQMFSYQFLSVKVLI